MVFHVTNYMRETNVWMIRKFRWITWSIGSSVLIFRATYWDYLGRRRAWSEYYFGGTPEEQRARAEAQRADWGYHPRYEAKYDFSIKKAKYAQQTREEAIRDMPRLSVNHTVEGRKGNIEPIEVRNMINIFKEHNRQPGVFDYSVPQYFYSTYPEIETDTYIVIDQNGPTGRGRRVHTESNGYRHTQVQRE